MKNKSYDYRTSYIDLLLNLFAFTLFLFMLSQLLINPIKKNEDVGIKKNAQFIIQIKWQDVLDCDVDLWVRGPDNMVVSFNQKSAGLMNLERDDLGIVGDIYATAGGKIIRGVANEEVLVIRQIVPGQYTVNVHLYGCRNNNSGNQITLENYSLALGTPADVKVSVKLIKLNPSYIELRTDELSLDKIWQEKTAFSFSMDEKGQTSEFDTTPVKLIKVK